MLSAVPAGAGPIGPADRRIAAENSGRVIRAGGGDAVGSGLRAAGQREIDCAARVAADGTRLKSSGFDVPAVKTTAEQPGLIVRPLKRWLLVVLSIALDCQRAAAQGQGRGIGRVVDDVGRRRARPG